MRYRRKPLMNRPFPIPCNDAGKRWKHFVRLVVDARRRAKALKSETAPQSGKGKRET